jgi:16S rRNA G1207 methylase RsmC
VDIDPRAIACSELNFREVPGLSAWGSNLFSHVLDRDYDLIVSNIPAKPTKEVHTELIAEAKTHLRQGGQIYIVAAGRLYKYLARLLDNTFGNSEKIAHSRSHTVVAAHNLD